MCNRIASRSSLLACCLIAGVVSADPDHTYLEEGGIVVFEVEDAEPADGWTLKTDLEDFSGTGYFEWTGPASFSTSVAGRGAMTYHFRIQTAGNYQIRWRSHIAIGDDNKEHNDSWIRLATGVNVPEEYPLNGWTKNFMNALGSWSWVSQTVDHVGEPLRQYFAEGDHTLEISGRSTGHAIDRIVLYRYDDVNFSHSKADDWDLSSVVTGDGTLVDPNNVNPVEPEPEPEPEPEVTFTKDNLTIAETTWQDHPAGQCIDNTLALAATEIAAFNPSDSASDYVADEYLPVSFEESVVLLKFDMSLLPPATSAILEYSTGDEPVNGRVVYSLGSHSNWQLTGNTDIQHPDSMLELARAEGGWDEDARHQSILPALLLGSDVSTLKISNDAESEPLQLYAQVGSELSPRLMMSGDENFCSTWQANVDAFNTPIEEVVDPVEPEPAVEPPIPPTEKETDSGEKSDASATIGSLSWWLLSVMLLSLGGSIIRQTHGTKVPARQS